jgi:hypothetical protein
MRPWLLALEYRHNKVIIKMLHLALARNFFLPPTPASQIKAEALTIVMQAPTQE